MVDKVMDVKVEAARWSAMGSTIRGANHRRKGMPNQDYIGWTHKTFGGSDWIIMAVSDGHGGSRYYRSSVGSRIAVECALEVLGEFVQSNQSLKASSSINEGSLQGLPGKIVELWVKKVAKYHRHCPATQEELRNAGMISDSIQSDVLSLECLIPYGATLLAAAASSDYVIFLQLGDGDIITVDENGKASRPMPKDPRLLGNETTSLCQGRPWEDFKVLLCNVEAKGVAMILMSTDGYSNSFIDEDNFLKAARDIHDILKEEPMGKVEEHLDYWMIETSELGSGDDISVGIILNNYYYSKQI